MTHEFPLIRQALDHMAAESAEDETFAKAGHEGLTALEGFLADVHRMANALEKMQISASRIEGLLTPKVVRLAPDALDPQGTAAPSWQENH